MIKIRKIKKIFFVSISSIFLTVICIICIFIGIFFFRPALLLPLYEFGLNTYACAKYYVKPYPSNEWVRCERIEDIWKYLENEKVQKITFCVFEPDNSPDKWWTWGEVVEPEKIKHTLQLIRASKIDGYIGVICFGRMKIITDRHKFIIPVTWDDKEIFSYRWESAELRKQLWKWGFPGPEYNYVLPPKEKIIAILLYPNPSETVPPLALFGDKKLAEKLIFEPDVKDDPNGTKGPAGLYKTTRLCQFGVKSKEEVGKYIYDKELEPKHVFQGRGWLEKIVDAYEAAIKEAEKREKYFPMGLDNPIGRIVFMTEDVNYWKEEIGIDANAIFSDTRSPLLPRDYWKEIGIDANTVFDDYIKSEQLKAYFDELGLTKELLAGEPNEATPELIWRE